MIEVELIVLGLLLVGATSILRRRRKPILWFDSVILNPDSLLEHAAELGAYHKIQGRGGTKTLLHRLQDNFTAISWVYREAAEDARQNRDIPPDGDWLLDNYYILEEQVEEILLSLRRRRFGELPVLANGSLQRNPRIYAIALELVSHTDAALSEELLVKFINAYQQKASLSIAEIWSLSLMVRIALLEKIRHSCDHLAATLGQWRRAETLLGSNDPEGEIAQMEDLDPSFVEHVLEILRQDSRRGDIQVAVAEKLLDQDMGIEKMVQLEHQNEASRTASLGNAIISLKNISTLDWDDVFEALCPVDKLLSADDVYREMDFESRNYYRRRVQKLASRAGVSEARVTKLVLECAREGVGFRGHCGYYLLDRGQEKLAKKLGLNPPLNLASGQYIMAVVLVSLVVAAVLGLYAGPSFWVLAALLILIPVSEVVINILQRGLSFLRRPGFLPKMEYRRGIPQQAATLVVVPTLLIDGQQVLEQVAKLEVHYLANPDANLHFALLADFKDSVHQEEQGDEDLIGVAQEGISQLEDKYGRDKFFLLVRERKYSPTQQRWMGWERKRGALVELNALLCGSRGTTFIQPPQLPRVSYVLTLDADTRLPLGMAKKLVGTISHPLNQVVWDKGKVVRGYGIIQPRICVGVESANATPFAGTMTGPVGLDTYTTAISDVYQDWFGQGIFTGKGIYDVNAAHQILADLPENSILSHDLLEGGLLRTGLATDLELVDDFPTTPSAYWRRQHRWIRGDWQLLAWLRKRVRDRWGERCLNPLAVLARWQILDNMRRSLLPLALFLFLAAGLTLLPGSPLVWTVLFLVVLALPPLLSLVQFNWWAYFRNIANKTPYPMPVGPASVFRQLALALVFLPHQVWLHSDAILRTLYRLFVSRKNLLEWTTAAEEAKARDHAGAFAPSLALVAGLGLAVLLVRPGALVAYIPLLIIWLAAPLLARRLGKSKEEGESLTQSERKLLRNIARHTWYYYQDLVDAESNYLPPDNFQVSPPNGRDSRTSPTNIGFYLLSVLAARDFGFITTRDLVQRIGHSLDAVEKLAKWKGHLFNWYDTRDLELLRPYFVSTVDSGNFAAMLHAVVQGLKEYKQRPMVDAEMAQTLAETLGKDISLQNFSMPDWTGLLTDLAWEQNPRAQNLVALFREEADRYFLHTEVLTNPPVFLKEDRYQQLAQLLEALKTDTAPASLVRAYGQVSVVIDGVLAEASQEQRDYLLVLKEDILHAQSAVQELVAEIDGLAGRLEDILTAMDFSALYNAKRQLLAVGYSVDDEKLVDASYDLLASEARLTSYLAVVHHQVPVKHWFKPGRAMTKVDGARTLVSWAGTMFEYLMPELLLKSYPNTLLGETNLQVIAAQRSYARRRGVPWGVSESGYFGFDHRLNYQYKAFGIPDLGLKRGLVEDMVVSPYSTLLALPWAPRAALDNIRQLLEAGMEGEYGLYEAVDYTPQRMSKEQGGAVVRSYMAYHQGMGFIALANYLHDFAMVRRFHADPRIQAGELLLQEKIPIQPILTKQIREPVSPVKPRLKEEPPVVRSYGVPRTLPPHCHLLSNGSYTVMLTDSGCGYSQRGDVQLSRWRRDALAKQHGSFVFVKNLNSENVWSATHAPLGEEPDFYRVRFHPHGASYFLETGSMDTRTEIVVSTEEDAELRQVTLTNHDTDSVSLEVTSYLELALSHPSADLAHPAFSKLFVQTEVPWDNCLLASRRPRSVDDPELFALHMVAVDGEVTGNPQFETDRSKFLGRGRDITNPAGLEQPLSNSAGAVLDPIFSLRRQIELGPGETAVLTFVTAQGDSRQDLLELADKYSNSQAVLRAFELAATRSRVENRYLNLGARQLEVSQEALGHLLFPSPTRRRYAEKLAKSSLSQQGLWSMGISGDNPIVLVNIGDAQGKHILVEAIQAHEYWRFKGLDVDLVILNREEGGYLAPLRELITETIQYHAENLLDVPGGIFVRNLHQISQAEENLLYASASLVLQGGKSLREQLEFLPPLVQPTKEFPGREPVPEVPLEDPTVDLQFFNGYGGFAPHGREYVIYLRDRNTPAPWINVIANPDFGFTVSERGAGFVFAENSRENKLTPWSNDPVSDPAQEAVYLRDDSTGQVWTVTAAPIREPEPYSIHHGWGYSQFKHNSHGIQQQLTLFVPRGDSVKLSLLRLKNPGKEPRRLTLTYYVRPVLGVSEAVGQQQLVTQMLGSTFTIRNPYNGDFPGRVVWLNASKPLSSYTGDREEFIGLGGSLARPQALARQRLSNTVGAGLDCCAAIQLELNLAPGQMEEVVLQLGQGEADSVPKLLEKYGPKQARSALAEVKKYWRKLLEGISIKSPEASFNIILPWLAYQAVACRLWARSGFYQAGGAFGFRDQLQDAMNLANLDPGLVRKQILLHARHQFPQGDVQHWWHPGTGNRGVRTRFSDDLLWLPLATAEYIEKTGDLSVLDEEIPFIQAEPLAPTEDERYGQAEVSRERASLYEHCLRAIKRSLSTGGHGLPLMGSGDWNDGMNTVGNKGKGESVWMAWFLYTILQRFAPLCRARGDDARTEQFLERARKLAQAAEEAWDGRWYRRAYFDDGTPLGSARNSECSIDSLPQSWAVISGAAQRERMEDAMAAVESHLVREDEGLLLLFAPPFGRGQLKPGYIKGYLPGVRENGGQYTHAACWVVQATAMLGRGDRALELFQLINPVNHSRTDIECHRYKTEPYALAADVYSVPPHTGRGGWTWYTGAAGWLYRVAVEDILGLKRKGNLLYIQPSFPRDWREFEVSYRWGSTWYKIQVRNPQRVNTGPVRLKVDGKACPAVELVDDGKSHQVEVSINI